MSAFKVFETLGIALKNFLMSLENYEEEAPKQNMKVLEFKQLMIYAVNQIFTFFAERVDEVSAFLYIIDEQLKSACLKQKFKKTTEHSCCMRFFPDQELEEKFK